MTMRVASLLLVVLLTPCAARAQGSIRGCVTEKGWGPLSGVSVVLTGPGGERRATSDSKGCYALLDVPSGEYTIAALLAGFESVGPDGGVIFDPRISVAEGAHLTRDFLMTAVIAQVNVAVPAGGLRGLYDAADVVVRLRTASSTKPARHRVTRHTGVVAEWFKWTGALPPANGTLDFRQEEFIAHDSPVYPVGQDLVLFLRYRDGDLYRVCYEYGAFLLEGGRVQGSDPFGELKLASMTVEDFLAELRAIAKVRR
jgi:hypothetical protein